MPLPPSLPGAPLDYADPARRARARLDWYAFSSTLIGWAVFGALMFAMVLWVIPRFEDIFKDFKLDLPGATKTLLSISRRCVLLPVLVVPFALAHAFAVAAWYPRSSRLGRFIYRLVMTLVLGAIAAYIVIGLFAPYVTLMQGISGTGGSKK